WQPKTALLLDIGVISARLKASDETVMVCIEDDEDPTRFARASPGAPRTPNEVYRPLTRRVRIGQVDCAPRVEHCLAQALEVLVGRRVFGPLAIVFNMVMVLPQDVGIDV